MGSSSAVQKSVLILYYSYSSQTKNLLHAMGQVMEDKGLAVRMVPLEPLVRQHFPIGTIPRTFWKMMLTFFRQRIPVKPLPRECFADYDLIILAGPTWSYNPSGPILAFFDRDGKEVLADAIVLPLISCRGYWRMHWWGLKGLIRKCGGSVPNLIVFSHPSKEPWRTIGVFLKLAGRVPERMGWMEKHYRKYGHTRTQIAEAGRFGGLIAETLLHGGNLSEINFRTDPALRLKEL
jgi:hypothetical protein